MTNTPERSNSRWLVVALLTLGIIIAYTDRINLSAALPAIRESFPLTAAASGVLLSAFFWAYTLLQTPAGWVVDRFGLKWPYAAAMLLWSAASAATALVSSVHGLIALRMVLGIGEAAAVPASMRYIRENFAERERGLPMGILMSGTKYGPAIGAPIATYLVMGFGWRWMFVLNGAFSVFWLVPWLFLVRDDQRTATVANEPEPATKVSWGAIFGSRVIWGTCLATFCYMYFVYFCMTWMPTYFKERFGFSLTASSWYTFMSFAGTGTIAILAGWAADRLIARGRNAVTVRKAFTIAGFVLAFSAAFGAFSHSTAVTLFLAVFSLSGLGLATANYWALTQTLTPRSVSARVAGIQNTAANIAGIAAPWITGLLIQKTGSFNAPLVAVGFWLLVGIGCYLFLVRERYAVR
ncbi:MAG: transporter, family, D-galactonate transporter [Acidobacteriaceae bacterium]|nr:transporter, family, D-galactonate transporter [Acidobacteriaceae bacterium]